jgi:hypothetical protein
MNNNQEIIDEYNITEAIDDGTVSRLGTTNNLTTVGALTRIMERRKVNEAEAMAILAEHVARNAAHAIKEWDSGSIHKLDDDLNTTTGTAIYWLIPSELGGVTIMRPSEY